MSAKREASTPPAIRGFRPVRLLGMGGFADVFLYEQEMPRRHVAVKVLLASALGDEIRERFRAEADLMATLSHHPSIVTVFGADMASDGRPYLVMEYCSRPSLGERYRSERMSVAEVLRIGVRLASAVETAHRAGILHRDIKPANVLVTDFGWPALTDFGIAATTATAAVGMSIPWSPPELLADDPHGDARSDVYSLAATVYSLLAGRSPFELPGGPNTAADLVSRIERASLPLTGRVDVPSSLEAVLARAMDRDPARRHHSALALARALQQVEAELSLALTPLDLSDEAGEGATPVADAGGVPGTDQATRLRPITAVAPDGPPRGAVPPPADPVAAAGVPAIAVPTAVADARTAAGPDGVPLAWRDQAAVLAERQAPVAPSRRGRRVAAVVATVVVVLGGGAAAALALRPPATPEPEPTGSEPPPITRAVPAPTDLIGAVVGSEAVFTWANPDPLEGDRYTWARLDPAGVPGQAELVTTATVNVPASGEDVCVEVALVRADGRSSAPVRGCADR